jgi:hypothetical protein
MAKQHKIRWHRPPEPVEDRDQDPVDDVGSLVDLTGNQSANGYPQGIAAVVGVYGLMRLVGLLVRFMRSGSRPRS